MSIKRIGITGYKGFIGKHLLNRLPKEFSKTLFLPFDPRYDDIPSRLNVIYHLGFGNPLKYKTDFSKSRSIDLKISDKLVKYCKSNQTTLIFTSSSAVYPPSPLPVREDDEIVPVTSYGKAKCEVERLIADSGEFPFVILRLFNPYGSGQSKDFVICQIIDALINKTSITIQQPHSGRDFIYIDDCVNALIASVQISDNQMILNIGSGQETKIHQLARTISDLLEIDQNQYFKLNNNKDHPHLSSIADVKKMKKYLNIHYITLLKDGIIKLLHETKVTNQY